MKSVLLLFGICLSVFSFGQPTLPFYYENNLPLLAKPTRIAEYYSEYHTQETAHYYNHTLEYDSLGRIKKHVKSNIGLLDLDSLPEVFHTIISQDPITITYFFTYDKNSRLDYFSRLEAQEGRSTLQQDEDWNYDKYNMLTEHYFFQINSSDTVIRSPSTKRLITRDEEGRINRIDFYSYSFSDKGLVITDITEYKYNSDIIDSILVYKYTQGIKSLVEKKYNLTFVRHTPLNTDSLLFGSHTTDRLGEITEHVYSYDELNRKTSHIVTSPLNDTLEKNEWTYGEYKKTESTNGVSIEAIYDETGYPLYIEEFLDGNSRGAPSERNTRNIVNGRIENAIMEVWDPVTLFYRKDTEYKYYYENVTNTMKPTLVFRDFVYPNPTSGSISIDNIDGIKNLELISMNGNSSFLPILKTINLDVPKGIYLLQATYKNNSILLSRIVVQ